MYTVKRVKAIAAAIDRPRKVLPNGEVHSYTGKDTGKLYRWPSWLRWNHLVILEAHGLAKHSYYAAGMDHTDWIINPALHEK
jgi:hypothetical protein